MSIDRHETVCLVIGATYHFKGAPRKSLPDGRVLWKFPPSDYRLVAVAKDYRTCQDKVVYVGVKKDHDLGKYYLACLSDWHDQFELVTQPVGNMKLVLTKEGNEGRNS